MKFCAHLYRLKINTLKIYYLTTGVVGWNPALHEDGLIFRGGGLSHYGGTDTPLHSTLSICFLLDIAMKKSSFLDSLRKFVGGKALHFYVNGEPIVKN